MINKKKRCIKFSEKPTKTQELLIFFLNFTDSAEKFGFLPEQQRKDPKIDEFKHSFELMIFRSDFDERQENMMKIDRVEGHMFMQLDISRRGLE